MIGVEPRAWIDRKIHYYLADELNDPSMDVVTPLHTDLSLYLDCHDRRWVSDPIERPSRLDMCESCMVAARQRDRRYRQSKAVPPPRPSTGRPALDSPTAPAGADQRPAPARAPRRQP